MKKIFISLGAALLVACSSADFLTLQDSKVKESINFKISEEEALARLDEFLFNFDVPTRGAERTIKEVIPYCPSPKTRVSSNVPDTLLYMINFDHDEGYAILAADARLDPILALIDHGNYVPSEEYINEEFNQELMDDLELDEKDDFWCSSSLGPNGSFNYRDYNDMTDLISDYGQKIIDTSPYRIAEYKDWVEKEKIGPLVRVKWNQNTPYNNMCNDNLGNFTYEDNGKYPAGCVAIAMAQILAYHHYPESAFNYIYNWDVINMVNVDSDNNNINDINYKKNVSHLVRAAGVACRTKYSTDGSSSTAYRAKQALRNTFNYPGTKRHLSFAATQIRSCLENNCPVMLTGKPKCRFTGHAWIIDGYKLQNREKWERVYADAECTEYIGSKYVCDEEVYYYHCNFGWGGIADGYYLGKIFDTVSGPESREAGVDYNEDENDEVNGSEAYTWMFRTVTYNNPNI